MFQLPHIIMQRALKKLGRFPVVKNHSCYKTLKNIQTLIYKCKNTERKPQSSIFFALLPKSWVQHNSHQKYSEYITKITPNNKKASLRSALYVSFFPVSSKTSPLYSVRTTARSLLFQREALRLFFMHCCFL